MWMSLGIRVTKILKKLFLIEGNFFEKACQYEGKLNIDKYFFQ